MAVLEIKLSGRGVCLKIRWGFLGLSGVSAVHLTCQQVKAEACHQLLLVCKKEHHSPHLGNARVTSGCGRATTKMSFNVFHFLSLPLYFIWIPCCAVVLASGKTIWVVFTGRLAQILCQEFGNEKGQCLSVWAGVCPVGKEEAVV